MAIDVESLFTASDSSSKFLPFPPITSLDDKKNSDQQKKESPKKSHGDFVSPAPRPPHGTASSSAPNPELASIVDNANNDELASIVDNGNNDDQRKGDNEGEPLNVDHLNSRSSTCTTFGEAASSQPPIDSNHDHVSVGSRERPHDSMAEDGHCVSDSRHAFASPSPNTTPAKATRVNTHDDTAPLPSTPAPLAPLMILHHNPIKALAKRTFRPQGALPTGFPEPRDLMKDVQGGNIPVRGQNRFSKIDIFSYTPTTYHDTSPLPPPDLLAALSPSQQILLFGDELPYRGFLKCFSIADTANFEYNKLIGLVSFAILPNLAPFQDELPFPSHRTIVKQIVAMLRAAKEQEKITTV